MSRTQTTVAPALQAYFLETSAEAAAQPADRPGPAAAEPPWSGRRLKHALADLGPAQPAMPDARTEPGAGPHPHPHAEAPRSLPPPARPAPAMPERAAWLVAETGRDLPPAVASLIAALPAQTPLRPDEIVRALAGTGPASVAVPALPAPRVPPEPMLLVSALAEAAERPPMIIERAHAERELRAGTPSTGHTRPNPLPALAAGFASALATGAALYLVLVLR